MLYYVVRLGLRGCCLTDRAEGTCLRRLTARLRFDRQTEDFGEDSGEKSGFLWLFPPDSFLLRSVRLGSITIRLLVRSFYELELVPLRLANPASISQAANQVEADSPTRLPGHPDPEKVRPLPRGPGRLPPGGTSTPAGINTPVAAFATKLTDSPPTWMNADVNGQKNPRTKRSA